VILQLNMTWQKNTVKLS